MGAGLDQPVLALAVLANGDVIVGGSFLKAGGMPANYIARYSPVTDTWASLGAGVNNSVCALAALSNGDVVVGGRFTLAGGLSISRIARYSAPGGWSAMGGGVSGTVNTLAALPGGDLIAGGSLLTAGGVSASRIARYSPAADSWSSLGSGMNTVGSVGVFASAALPGGDVMAGGDFGTAGGTVSAYVARYTFGQPSLTTQPRSGVACAFGSAAFSVTASGATSYQWQLQTAPEVWTTLANDPVPLPCGGFARAAPADGATTSIGVAPCPGVNHYEVRCVVTNSCGSAASDPATLTINSADFNGDGDIGTDADIEAFFACLAGNCCPICGSADFNGDGDVGTDADIEAFFRVLAGGSC